MDRHIETLQPAGLGVTLRLGDAPELAEALRAAMSGWPLERDRAASTTSPTLEAWRDGEGYRQRVPGEPRPRFLPSAASAACSLIADLLPAALAEWPHCTGLHCAAVEVERELVLFPATHRAGKSLLSAAFAAAGHRVFGDDVLALTERGEGMALGIAPRLRLPLPATLPPALARFIADHDGVSDDRYRYLDLGDDRLAGHGETRPIGAIVLLDRVPGIPRPSLTRLSPGDGLLQLLCQSFAGAHDWATLLERFHPLMQDLPCLLLRYDEPMAAVEGVVAGLAGGEDTCLGDASLPEAVAGPSGGLSRSPATDPETPWQRWPGIFERSLGDELFLIDAAGVVHRLNAVAAAVWRLLGVEPLAPAEIVALLAEHFRGVVHERLMADVMGLIEDLAGAGLIVRPRPA